MLKNKTTTYQYNIIYNIIYKIEFYDILGYIGKFIIISKKDKLTLKPFKKIFNYWIIHNFPTGNKTGWL